MNRYHIPSLIGLLVFCFTFSLSYVRYDRTFEDGLAKLSDTELFDAGQYYFNHGDAADGTYNLDRAYRYFGLLAVQYDNPLVWYQLGRIDFLLGDNLAAISKFARQEEQYGMLVPKVLYMRGLTHAYAAANEPEFAAVHFTLADEYFQRYIVYQPNAAWPYVDLAWVYFMQGDFVRMYELLQPVANQFSDNPWFLNMYAIALRNTGSREQALIELRRAYSLTESMTAADWGDVYPGNNPKYWKMGLDEFRAAIVKNIETYE